MLLHILLLILLQSTYSQKISTNLLVGRNKSFIQWCEIVFMPNHRGWSGNQPSEEWTNISVAIFPYIAKEFQLTASSSNEPSETSAYIPLANSSVIDGMFQVLHFSIFYWDNVFSIYLGLYRPVLVNISKESRDTSPFCDVSYVKLGESPQ